MYNQLKFLLPEAYESFYVVCERNKAHKMLLDSYISFIAYTVQKRLSHMTFSIIKYLNTKHRRDIIRAT